MILIYLFILQAAQVAVSVNTGEAEYYSIQEAKWLALKTSRVTPHIYIRSKNSQLTVTVNKETIQVPKNSFFYLNDLMIVSLKDLVDEISILDIETFNQFKSLPRQHKAGMVYGENEIGTITAANIPFLDERLHAIDYFKQTKRYYAALLMQKRVLVKYPQLYNQQSEVTSLLDLYLKNGLNGMAVDEISSILNRRKLVIHKALLSKYESEILANL
ncbi:MAG: hypothetical protein KDD94_02510 [Calditrichaeota bacterium]|nr:hypothetical protein [Calditrichota bacterium]